ncbi:MAG: hypothetical protein HW416_2179 [Chloroflexi bacterium]|nr:hypothetical protein [Chloroflexota bacterium]
MLWLNVRAGAALRRAPIPIIGRAEIAAGRASSAASANRALATPPLAKWWAAGRADRFFEFGAGRRPRGALGTWPPHLWPTNLLGARSARLYRTVETANHGTLSNLIETLVHSVVETSPGENIAKGPEHELTIP